MAERPSDKNKSKPSSSKRKDEKGGSDEEEDPELQGLTQVQREKVLNDRYEKEQKEKKLQELKGGNKGNMAQKLSELKNKRQNAKDKKERMQAENRDSEEDGSESEGEINDKRRRKNDDEDYVVDDRPMRGPKPEKKRKRSPSQERKSPGKSQTVTMEALEKVRLSRKNLALLCSHTHFEKTVKGAFVRVTQASQTKPSAVDYLIAEIVGVKDYPKFYQVDDKETNKILTLKHGAKERPMKICFVSNGEFTGAEFTKWINKMQREGQRTPSALELEQKQKEISSGLNYRYSDDEIRKNINQRIDEKLKKCERLAHHEIEVLENKKFTMEKEYFADEKDLGLKKEIDKLNEIIKREKNRLKGEKGGKSVKKEEDKSILNEMDEMFGGDEEEEEKPVVKDNRNAQKNSKETQKEYDRGREVVHEEEEEKTEREKQIEDMKKKGLSVAELYEEMKREFVKAHKVDLSIDKLIDEWEIEGEAVA